MPMQPRENNMRKRPPHYSRDYRRHRAIADPSYLKTERKRQAKWFAEKVKRCPAYAEVERLNNRLNKLRELVRSRLAKAKQAELELIATAKRYNSLREKCKGK